MGPFTNIYVLALHRSSQVALDFLDALLPNREQSAEDYRFPEFSSQPKRVIARADDAIRYSCEHTDESIAVYYRSLRKTSPAHGMVMFTPDGAMILGVSVLIALDDDAEFSAEAGGWLLRLMHATRGLNGLVQIDAPPPRDTVREFLKAIETAMYPKLVAGEVKYR